MDAPRVPGLERGEAGDPTVLGRFNPDGLVKEWAYLLRGRGFAPDDSEADEIADLDLSGEVNLTATIADVGSGGVIAVRYAVEPDARDFDMESKRDALAAATLVRWSNAHICSLAYFETASLRFTRFVRYRTLKTLFAAASVAFPSPRR